MGELVKQGVGDEESDPTEVGEGTEAAAAGGGRHGASKSSGEARLVSSKIDVVSASGAGISGGGGLGPAEQNLGGVLVDSDIAGSISGSVESGTLERKSGARVAKLVGSSSISGEAPAVVGFFGLQLALTISLGCAGVVLGIGDGPSVASGVIGTGDGVDSDVGTVPVGGGGATGGNTDNDAVSNVCGRGGGGNASKGDDELGPGVAVLGPAELVASGGTEGGGRGAVGAHGGQHGGGKKQKCKHS